MTERDRILENLARILGPEELKQASADLEMLNVSSDDHWLLDVVQAAATLPLPEVPDVVTQDLKALMGATDELIATVEATLVADSRNDRPLAGVRGSEAAAGWSLSYASQVADLVLDVFPDDEGRLEVEGQVMAYGATESAYRASASGPQEVTAEGDRLGRFELGHLEPGTYRLTVTNDRLKITTEIVLEEPL